MRLHGLLVLSMPPPEKHFQGTSLAINSTSQRQIPVVIAGNVKLPNATFRDAQLCKTRTLDPRKVRGRILVCLRGRTLTPVEKGQEAKCVGTLKMILQNDMELNTATADVQPVDTSNLPQSPPSPPSGKITSYFKSKNPFAFMNNAKTVIPVKPAPRVSAFSSRGPNVILPTILKLDVTAPGQDIITAYSSATSPTNLDSDEANFDYNILSGTSQACPHVSSIAGLLKTHHPNWSPAMIKSAIMTTASILDNTIRRILDEQDGQVTTPFHHGIGFVRPNLAIDPGLVYYLNTSDYPTCYVLLHMRKE